MQEILRVEDLKEFESADAADHVSTNKSQLHFFEVSHLTIVSRQHPIDVISSPPSRRKPNLLALAKVKRGRVWKQVSAMQLLSLNINER